MVPKAAALARIGKLILPGYTISTKVTPSMGRIGAPDEQPPPEDGKGHDRVSMRFASELIGARGRIAVHQKNLSKDFRLLMTHGRKDEVCPIGYAREFYSKLQIRMKEFREYPEHLHYLFHDPLVMDFGRDWLNRVLEPPRLVRRC